SRHCSGAANSVALVKRGSALAAMAPITFAPEATRSGFIAPSAFGPADEKYAVVSGGASASAPCSGNETPSPAAATQPVRLSVAPTAINPGDDAGTLTVPSFFARDTSGPTFGAARSPSPSTQTRADAGPSTSSPKVRELCQLPSMMTTAPS